MRDDPDHYLTRKERRHEKKRAGAKDRSKFKKTDRDKREKKTALDMHARLKKKELKRGRVLAITPEGTEVDLEGEKALVTLRGSLKKEQGKQKNLLIVGDFVWIEPDYAIAHVEQRRSVLSRRGHIHSHRQQLIAANIDQVLITVSVASPPLKPSLVDRYIIAALKGKMDLVIVVNKIDLLKEKKEERFFFDAFVNLYSALGFRVLGVSAEKNQGLTALKKEMTGKASVFSGQSGVGKSSLINAITGLGLATKEVIKKTQKGAHTTAQAQLIPLTFGGWCIDTPGIRSFGIWDLERRDLVVYFPEITEGAKECRYPNCTHLHEPGCHVQKMVESGAISALRFASYKKLIHEL
ncbi:MAG: ribosome small subunit-dependent GTPase A [Chlamydiia bacterium]|nr:ribosome small subunit-dependent GTPase A [Chlamydiia bacterium]